MIAAPPVTIPFTVFDNRILVQTSIDGVPGLTMILDTGAGGVGITPETAQRLHLHVAAGGTVSGAGALRPRVGRADLTSVSIGGRDLGKQSALVVDLSTIRRAFGFPRLDGIVGYNALRAPYVRIDPAKRLLTVSDSSIAVPSTAHHTPFSVRGGLLHVAASVDGVEGDFIVDTGDRSSLTLFSHFARQNNFYNISQATRNVVTGYGIGGPIHSNVFASHLSAFGYELPDVRTRVPVGNAGVFSSSADSGSIGNGVLLRFTTLYDAVHGDIAAWPVGPAVNAPSPHDVSATAPPLARHGLFGASLRDKPEGVTVAAVISGSAAMAAGVQAGDLIKALDGNPIATVEEFLTQMHLRHAGDRVLVLVTRNGTAQQFSALLGAPAEERDAGLQTTYGTVAVDGTLRRTLLTYPASGSGPFPAVLLLGGIGCFSVDAASNPQDAYMRLTHDISRAGFLTMRLEKSGVGDSEGPPCRSVDFAAEERSYDAALSALLTNPHVDAARVYLLGHSIGSLEAPRLAAERRVAGVIVMEAVGRDWPEYEIRNLRRQLELGGSRPAEVDAALVEKHVCMTRLLFENEREADIERSQPDCKTQNGVYPVDPSYMRQVARVNVIDAWNHVSVPVLAVYGTSDFVTEQEDHRRIVDVVNSEHAADAMLAVIPHMDHLLFVAATPKVAMDAFAGAQPRVYDADLSKAIVSWLTGRS